MMLSAGARQARQARQARRPRRSTRRRTATRQSRPKQKQEQKQEQKQKQEQEAPPQNPPQDVSLQGRLDTLRTLTEALATNPSSVTLRAQLEHARRDVETARAEEEAAATEATMARLQAARAERRAREAASEQARLDALKAARDTAALRFRTAEQRKAREAMEAAEAAADAAWRKEQEVQALQRAMQPDALAAQAGRVGSTAVRVGGWVGTEAAAYHNKVTTGVAAFGDAAENVIDRMGDGDYEGAQRLLPAMMRRIVVGEDGQELRSVAETQAVVQALHDVVAAQAKRVQAIAPRWMKATRRVLTTAEKQRFARMWDYVSTHLQDLLKELALQRMLVNGTLAKVKALVAAVHADVVVPLTTLTNTMVTLSAAGRLPDTHDARKALRADFRTLSEGLRRLQTLMAKSDWALAGKQTAGSNITHAFAWVGSVFGSVTRLLFGKVALGLWGVLGAASQLWYSSYFVGRVVDPVVQATAQTFWKRWVANPTKAAIDAATASRSAGTMSDEDYAAFMANTKQAALPWYTWFATRAYNLLMMAHSGTVADVPLGNVRTALGNDIPVSDFAPFPAQDGAEGWGVYLVKAPFRLTTWCVDTLLQMVGRGTEPSTEGTVAWLLWTAARVVLVGILFPLLLKLIHASGRAVLRRLFRKRSALSDREQWQCDTSAAQCRAVLIPRRHLGPTYASRARCARECKVQAEAAHAHEEEETEAASVLAEYMARFAK